MNNVCISDSRNNSVSIQNFDKGKTVIALSEQEDVYNGDRCIDFKIFAIKMRSDLIKNIVQEHLSYRQAKKNKNKIKQNPPCWSVAV